MAKYLTKFNTSADYNSALFTLDLPNVSAVNGVVTYLTQYPISDCSWYVTDSSGNVVYGKLASVSTVVNTSEIPEEITNGKLYITASATSIQNIAANLSNAEIYGLPSDFLENISVQFMSNYPHEGFDLSNTETITAYTPFQNNTHITTADLRGITTMPNNPIFSGCPNIATVYSPKVAGTFYLGSGFTDTHIYVEPEIQQLGTSFISNSTGGTDGVIVEIKYNSEGYGINYTASNYTRTIDNVKIKKLIIDRCINSYQINPDMESFPENLLKRTRTPLYNNQVEEICFPDHDTHKISVYGDNILVKALKWHLGKTTQFATNSNDFIGWMRNTDGTVATITCDSDNPYYSAANNAILSKDGTEYLFAPFTTSNIVIPNTVTKIGEAAFYQTGGAFTVTIPSSVTTIGYYAFYGCSNLSSVTVEATTPPTLGGNAFDDTNNCPIYVPAASVDTYKAASQWSSLSSRIQAIPTE